jgi:RimJ/RimL family protein N-acetyltransferase
MIIRKAETRDSGSIATCFMPAMEEILYKFIKKEDYKTARDMLLYFISKENNQYSFRNCWVAEVENKIAAAVNIYDGAKLLELREPVIRHIRTNFNKDFNPEDETEPGEFYIDILGVHPEFQGRGIGTKLLEFIIDKYVTQNHQTLGLLVGPDNEKAKRLYLKLGFQKVGIKVLVGKEMEHLQLSIYHKNLPSP